MKLRITAAIAAVLIIFAFSSCQQVFTASAYFWVVNDISTMSPDQKVSYAEDLLSSGSSDELGVAYAAIAELLPADYTTATDLTAAEIELVLLAADLAVGSSKIGETLTSAIDSLATGEGVTPALLDNIVTTNLESAVTLIEAAIDNGAELTSEQYTNAAAAQLLIVVGDAGGIDNLGTVDPLDPDLVQAQAWALEGGVDIEALLAGGLPA
jgi:hypothetical protein